MVAMAACLGLAMTTALGQDPLNRGRGGGTGDQRQRSDPPTRNDPPARSDPGRTSPPPRQDPPRRQDPPARTDPPKRDIPERNFPPERQDPPKRQDPPARTDPPKRDIPERQNPPQRQDPPRRQDPPARTDPGKRDIPERTNPPSRQDPPKRDIPERNFPPRNGPPIVRGDENDRGTIIDRGRTNPQDGERKGSARGSVIGSNQRVNDELLKRKSGSRSGTVKYGSNTNQRRTGRTGSAINIDRMPSNVSRGSMSHMIRRADEIRIGGVRIRFGYNHYDSRWCDDYFYYPHYVFDPYGYDWAFSPWYYYPQLPGYFNAQRCYFPTTYMWSPFYGVRYQYRQPSQGYWNRDYNELDYVIEDITYAFQDADRRSVQRLVPRNGRIGIIVDGRYAYSLNPEDFYDTLMDAVENTRTIDYRILDVQYRRDAASVFAQHDFEDPWGRRISVYHYYKLEIEGRNWVIREFGTSNNRW